MTAPSPSSSQARLQPGSRILTINGGSSSIKFALFRSNETLDRSLSGKIDRMGLENTTLEFHDFGTGECASQPIDSASSASAIAFLLDWLEERIGLNTLDAVGHRVVHGMQHTAPERVSQQLIDDLRAIVHCDPQHLPGEIELIEAFRSRVPSLAQFACFDTGFHRTIPRVAKLLAIPRRFDQHGVQRYGFHGLSYTFLMQELVRLGDASASNGRVILAHLGNGASLAAVRDGKSIDTSMGFTPTAGLPMSTRAGDLDPGLFGYLSRTENLTAEEFDQMVNHHSGLLGISETSSDMRDLLALESVDIRAAEAVELFCYHVKKWLGSFVAALGGLNTLVFAGGIGENTPIVRSRICAGLNCFGIEIDDNRNESGSSIISTEASRVTVRVLRTDEEIVIARSVMELLKTGSLADKR
ncbi:MAG: acetate/propionate family kinase [Planctomycetota bacterium]|nr:acetate/propionate family kinase [Planctomycetota bacterium]